MNPAEAGAIELEEPDWRIRFEEHILHWPKLPYYLACDSAFNETLRDWRRFHKKPAVDGIIALAHLQIFPPRSLARDIPRGGAPYKPDLGDDHCWLQIAGRAWRIVAIEDRMLMLDSFGEQKQIDLNKAKWDVYLKAAIQAISNQL